MADDEHVQVIYDQWGPEYNSYIIEEEKFRREADCYAGIFSEHEVESVHDCACGTGRHTTYFAEWGYDAEGSDLSDGMLEQARERAREKGLDVRFFQAAFHELGDRAGRRYDGILCAGLGIAHLTKESELVRALENIYSIMNPGGVAIFENPPVDKLVDGEEPVHFGPLRVAQEDEQDLLNFRILSRTGEHTLTYGVVVLRQGENGDWDYEVRSFPLRMGITVTLERLLPEVGFREVEVRGSVEFLPEYGETDLTLAVK